LVIFSSLASRDSSCHAPKKVSIWSVIVSSKQYFGDRGKTSK
jgi:hypothetical protein